jgi:hypothetical protein
MLVAGLRLESKMAVLQRRHWDVRPSQYGVGALRNMALAGPEPPYNPFAAAENLLDCTGVGIGDNPDFDAVASGFLIVDRSNLHRREAYAIPIGDMASDGTVRVHTAALEPAERALRLHPAGDDVRAEALAVLDHYKRRFTAGEKPVPPAAVGGRRIFTGSRLARRAHAEALKRKLSQEEKRRAEARSRELAQMGEAGRRREAAKRMEAFRNEHDMMLPILLNR